MPTLRLAVPAALFLACFLGAASAQAKSCHSFVQIVKYDPDGERVLVKHERGNVNKYFPKPEGSPRDSSKIPSKCRKSDRDNTLMVTPTGGRMSITQIRTNFEGRMLNDTDDAAWFGKKIKELIDSKEEVVVVIRPGMKRDDPKTITTIYMPANEEDLAEIKRLEEQAEDL